MLRRRELVVRLLALCAIVVSFDRIKGQNADLILSDTFTGTTNTWLSAHTPDTAPTGATWEQLEGGTHVVLQSNRVGGGAGATWITALVDTGAADGRASVDLQSAGSTIAGGLAFRGVDQQRMLMLWFWGTANGGTVGLYRRTAGEFLPIREQAVGAHSARHLEVRYTASVVQAVWNGEVLFTEPVEDYHTATRVGLVWNTSTDQAAQFDNLEVRTPDIAPNVTGPAVQTTVEGMPVSVNITATDPDSASLTYGASGLPSGLNVNATTGVISGTLGIGTTGDYPVTVSAADAIYVSTRTFTWTVTSAMVPAVRDTFTGMDGVWLTAHALDTSPNGAAWVQLEGGSAAVVDGNRVGIGAGGAWATGLVDSGLANGRASVDLFSTNATVAGGLAFRAVDRDRMLMVWYVGTSQGGTVGLYRRTDAEFLLLHEQTVGATTTRRLGAWFTGSVIQVVWNGAVLFSETVTEYQSATRQGMVWHGTGDPSAHFDNFEVRAPNLAPIITGPLSQTSATGDSILLGIAATDPDDTTLTYAASPLPPGVTVNSATGLMSGTISASGTGSFPVHVTVSDGVFMSTHDFTWTVSSGAISPILISASPTSGGVGTLVQLTGDHFGEVQGNSFVSFAGTVASPTSWGDKAITVPAPAGVITGDITVVVAGMPSTGIRFTYTGTGPNVTISYQPKPNTAGWYQEPVTAFFTCTPAGVAVQSCPQPVAITSEGAAQTVSATATDSTGNYTRVTATANIDFSSPASTITAPAQHASINAASTTVSATVSDAVSGVQTASCNGIPVVVTAGTISCAVPLGRGLNPLIVRVVDLAGNERTTSVVVSRVSAPAAIFATPSRYTLAVTEARSLSLVDDLGQAVIGASWSSSNTSVAVVDAMGVVSAVGAGEAVITASVNSLTADVSITALAGPLPSGAARWILDSLPDWYRDKSVAVDAVAAAFASLEVQFNGLNQVTATQLRSFDEEGRQVALITAPLSPGERTTSLMGDAAGGVLMTVGDQDSLSLVRVPVSPDDAIAWRVGGLSGYPSTTAQGPDGTIFRLSGVPIAGTQTVTYDNQAIVGIDGRTGSKRFVLRPIRPAYYCNPLFGAPTYNVSRFADSVAIDTEGYANVLGVVRDHNLQFVSPPSCSQSAQDDSYYAARVVLYRIAPDGTSTVIELERHDSIYGLTFRGPSYVLPDDQGGVLAVWEACEYSTTPKTCKAYAHHVDAGVAAASSYELPYEYSTAALVSGSNRTAYYGGNWGNPRKFDMVTGSVLWTGVGRGVPMAVRDDGRVELFGVTGRTIVDPTGVLASTNPVNTPLAQTAGPSRITTDFGDVRSVVGESFLPDPFGFAVVRTGAGPGGGLQGRGAAAGEYGIFAKSVNVLYGLTGFDHVGIHLIPRNQPNWLSSRPEIFLPGDNGIRFATVGGEEWPIGLCEPFGSLRSTLNRTADRSLNRVTHRERLRYPPIYEDIFVSDILRVDSYYPDNLAYACFPLGNDNYYNSNSYAAGLLLRSGMRRPAFPIDFIEDFPGWLKPVPDAAFLVP